MGLKNMLLEVQEAALLLPLFQKPSKKRMKWKLLLIQCISKK
jgi:hypothetical protein